MTTLTIIAWRCLDCPETWRGGALASTKPIELTEVGRLIRGHVLATGHTTAPVTAETGRGELPL